MYNKDVDQTVQTVYGQAAMCLLGSHIFLQQNTVSRERGSKVELNRHTNLYLPIRNAKYSLSAKENIVL